jgi:pimeloyl-ACP methyl ester carboxylesterase
MSSLGTTSATFYGCSSGGVAALDLLLDHPTLVRNVVIHEAAIFDPNGVSATALMGNLPALDDEGIAAACKAIFADLFNEDLAKWEALGAEYHSRLARNYVTWVRRYWVNSVARGYAPSDLVAKPIAWTIGGLTPAAAFFYNVQLAHAAKINIGLLMCRHFPQVSIPTVLAEHIRAQTLPFVLERT